MTQTGQNAQVNPEDAPARLVVRIFGLVGAAAIGGVGVDAVRKWARKRATGGLGGMIPAEHQRKYLLAAERLGKPLTAEQMVWEPY